MIDDDVQIPSAFVPVNAVDPASGFARLGRASPTTVGDEAAEGALALVGKSVEALAVDALVGASALEAGLGALAGELLSAALLEPPPPQAESKTMLLRAKDKAVCFPRVMPDFSLQIDFDSAREYRGKSSVCF
ncbi:hypothetical protein [Caballeronia sp. ATUFL_M2_KS44]|uniref:hypothetical protein n=1 Tax=Caballeronia sp. ATUFL_M2_KS44 TaxID=2921767 RepID=UPI002028B006|nr:hypothetical protein [Caballeronia sp. ATUFL_M2_KS44]